MSSEAAPTKDSAWEDFRALYLDYRQFVMIDARLMLDKTTPHPLAGVVGRVVVEPGRVVRLEIPPELAAATDAIGGAASELGVRSLMPLPAYMVERTSGQKRQLGACSLRAWQCCDCSISRSPTPAWASSTLKREEIDVVA